MSPRFVGPIPFFVGKKEGLFPPGNEIGKLDAARQPNWSVSRGSLVLGKWIFHIYVHCRRQSSLRSPSRFTFPPLLYNGMLVISLPTVPSKSRQHLRSPPLSLLSDRPLPLSFFSPPSSLPSPLPSFSLPFISNTVNISLTTNHPPPPLFPPSLPKTSTYSLQIHTFVLLLPSATPAHDPYISIYLYLHSSPHRNTNILNSSFTYLSFPAPRFHSSIHIRSDARYAFAYTGLLAC